MNDSVSIKILQSPIRSYVLVFAISLVTSSILSFMWGFGKAYLKDSPEYSFGLPAGVTSSVQHTDRKIRFWQHLPIENEIEINVNSTFAAGEVITIELHEVKMLTAVAHMWRLYLAVVDDIDHEDGKLQTHLMTFAVAHETKSIPEGTKTVKLQVVEAKAKTRRINKHGGDSFLLQENYTVKVLD